MVTVPELRQLPMLQRGGGIMSMSSHSGGRGGGNRPPHPWGVGNGSHQHLGGGQWAPGHLNALRPIRYQDELAPLLPACALDRLPPWGCELGGASGRLVLTGAIGLRRRANRRMTMAFKIRPTGTQTVPFTGASRILEPGVCP